MQQEEENSPLDNSVYNDLGSKSPKFEEKEVSVQVPHVSKVELSETTYKDILKSLSNSYNVTSAILGAGFLLASVGYFGDNLK